MFLKELFAYIISGEFSMKFSMEKEQTITRFSDCAGGGKVLLGIKIITLVKLNLYKIKRRRKKWQKEHGSP